MISSKCSSFPQMFRYRKNKVLKKYTIYFKKCIHVIYQCEIRRKYCCLMKREKEEELKKYLYIILYFCYVLSIFFRYSDKFASSTYLYFFNSICKTSYLLDLVANYTFWILESTFNYCYYHTFLTRLKCVRLLINLRSLWFYHG